MTVETWLFMLLFWNIILTGFCFVLFRLIKILMSHSTHLGQAILYACAKVEGKEFDNDQG